MDYNDLALFTRVVESGSFTSAAAMVGLPKSSVTRGIARLERDLGVRLIQRTTRQRGVTEAGRELYERIRGAVGALAEATDAVSQHGKAPGGVVRITAPVDVALMGIPEALAGFLVTYPSIQVELVLTARIVDLVAEGIDLGIRAGKLADSSLVSRKVGETSSGLFASKSYVKRHGRPRRLADLTKHACVMFRGRAGKATWTLEGPNGDESIEVHGPVSADDFSFVVRAIRAGLGIGQAPLFVARRDPAARELERVLPDYVFPGAPIQIVMPSASFVPARVAVVRDFLVAHLAGELAPAGE
ncbi:MAG: lysR [Myxococcales bacterium]|nr:lysR [Myxococcales bacterium]